MGTVFLGELVHEIHPLLAVSLVYFGAGILFIVTGLLQRSKPQLQDFIKYKKEFISYTIVRTLGASCLSYSLIYTASAKVVFFTKIEPYLVMFWMWLLYKQVPSGKNVTLLAIHIFGAIILSVGNFEHIGGEQWGDLLVVAAMALFSYSYPVGKVLSREINMIWLSGIFNCIAGILLYTAYCIAEGALAGIPRFTFTHFFVTSFIGLYLGIGLWLYTIKTLEPWIASSLRTLGPLVAAPIAWCMREEKLTTVQIVGALVVIVTSALISRQHKPIKA